MLIHYRCRVGHAYSDETLLDAQHEGVERKALLQVDDRNLEESA